MEERVMDVPRDILKPEIPESKVAFEEINGAQKCINDAIPKNNVP